MLARSHAAEFIDCSFAPLPGATLSVEGSVTRARMLLNVGFSDLEAH